MSIQKNISWDAEYHEGGNIWGEKPGPLASFSLEYLRRHNLLSMGLRVLDLGCGYGRDAFFLVRNMDCTIVGIDNSEEAIKMAVQNRPVDYTSKLEFRLVEFSQFHETRKYDVIYMANVYQVLRSDIRRQLIEIARANLDSRGFLFLSTLSVNDPEHFGKGNRVLEETNSFVDKKFIHLSTREELIGDFNFLSINKMIEHPYEEPRYDGNTHRHISWLLAGQKTGVC
jgi:SAM-dependent methyltransferase